MAQLATRLAVIGGLIGCWFLLAGASAVGAVHATVSPPTGDVNTVFIVSFVVDRPVDGYRWLTVEAVSTVRRSDCEHEESAAVTFAPKGKRVRVALRPIDKFRWCPGVYRGTIRVEYRVLCGEPGLDRGPCFTDGPLVTRFRFRVTHP